MPVPLLEIDRVTVTFGDHVALDDVSLSLVAGERLAVIGPSGAGKSTLLGLCNSLVVPSDGAVRFEREPVVDSDRWRRTHGHRVGTVYQQLQLAGPLRVVHNVNAGCLGSWSTTRALLSMVRPQEVDECRRVLARVGIEAKLLQRTDTLSGGEQQRVAIARTLRQDPVLMVADEPTANLDQARALEIMQLLTALAREDGRALLVSQHDVALARRTCDRVVGLRDGRIAFDVAADALDEAAVADLYALSPTR